MYTTGSGKRSPKVSRYGPNVLSTGPARNSAGSAGNGRVA
jgi:hypothetical protein